LDVRFLFFGKTQKSHRITFGPNWCEENVFSSHYFDVRKMYFPHIILMWGKCIFLTLFWCEENVFSSHYFDVRKMYFPHIIWCEENTLFWCEEKAKTRKVITLNLMWGFFEKRLFFEFFQTFFFFQSFCTKKWPNFFFNLFALKKGPTFFSMFLH